MSDLVNFEVRSALAVGAANMAKLRNAHVLILGLGGVGAYAAEMVVRSGVGVVTIVDGDVVEPSNRNRQLPALVSTEGRPKAAVMAERLLDINPQLKIHPVAQFIRDEATEELLSTPFDYAVDAIDSLSPKVHFLLCCREKGIPFISSMGSGGRLNPEGIVVADISETYNCKLARAVRRRLAHYGVRSGIPVVFSPELVAESAIDSFVDAAGIRHSVIGTVSYLPAMFGCMCAAAVVRGLLRPA